MPRTIKAKTASKRRNSNRIAAPTIAKEEESSPFDVTKEEEESSLFDLTSIPTPLTRKIRCYAFDPSHRRFFGNEMTLEVKWESLVPGPIGERIVEFLVANGAGIDRADFETQKSEWVNPPSVQ